MIASVFLGFGIIYQAFKMIYENGLLLIGESVNNQKIEAVLEDVFKNYRKISLVKSTIIKHGSF